MSDTVYYKRNPLIKALSLRARLSVIRRFNQVLRPGADTRILDVGVSLDVSHLECNVLEQVYPYPQNLTCAGIGSGDAVTESYPGVRFVQITPGRPLPFPDDSFDIVYSNAVIEHVGTRDQQESFVHELCRVGRHVFLVTPNRWFPIEHHTGIPLLHYLPLPIFRRLLRATSFHHWSDIRNLNPLTASELQRLFPRLSSASIEILGPGPGPLRSNIIAYL